MKNFLIGEKCYIVERTTDNKNYVVVSDSSKSINNEFIQKIECSNLTDLGAEINGARHLYKNHDRYQIFCFLNKKMFKILEKNIEPSINLNFNVVKILNLAGEL